MAEARVETDDRDCPVAQAGEIAGRVAGAGATAILVVGEVAHVVHGLDAPMPTHEFKQLAGIGLLRIERGQSVAGFLGNLANLPGLGAALDPDRLAAPVEITGAIPIRVAEIDKCAPRRCSMRPWPFSSVS